jgi:adenylylsulfate kinase
MLLIQMTGLSGAGKTTIAQKVKQLLEVHSVTVGVIDGDVYRKTICKDLGFSKEDRCENIRRLGNVADSFVKNGTIAIIAAINPYEQVRNELEEKYGAKTVWIKCDISILSERDPKGLYKRAMLPDDHPDKLFNLTGINDTYEIPAKPGLIIDTGHQTEQESAQKLYEFIAGLIGPQHSLSFPGLHTSQMPDHSKKE